MRPGVNHSIALNAAGDEPVALCAALPLAGEAEAPEWVHLLPAGPRIMTHDGRGPYRLDDPAQVIAASLEAAQNRGAVIDENHATDLAAPRGEPAPARGWLVDFEARADGIWGRVEWNAAGKALMAEKAYRGISPVIVHDKANRVLAVIRASLINKPNLKGLKALHQETEMNLLARLIAALKLEDGTSEEAVLAAVTALHGEVAKTATALEGMATLVGLEADASVEAITGAVGKLKEAPAGGKTVEALQAELADVTTKLNTLTETTARKAAEVYVDGAIKAGRVGIKPMRDEYIAMHMEDPAKTEKLIGAMPILNGDRVTPAAPPPKDGEIALNAEQLAVAKMLGQDPKTYAETLKLERDAAEAAV